MFRIGLFDTEYTPTAIPVAAARRSGPGGRGQGDHTAEESGDVLPLTGDARRSIAVIGADANILAAESGSAWVDPTTATPTLQGIYRPCRRRRQCYLHAAATTRSTPPR